MEYIKTGFVQRVLTSKPNKDCEPRSIRFGACAWYGLLIVHILSGLDKSIVGVHSCKMRLLTSKLCCQCLYALASIAQLFNARNRLVSSVCGYHSSAVEMDLLNVPLAFG